MAAYRSGNIPAMAAQRAFDFADRQIRRREQQDEADREVRVLESMRNNAAQTPIRKMIEFTAEFANEQPDILLRKEHVQARHVDPSLPWNECCSPKLEAHMREVRGLIAARFTHLRSLTVDDILKWNDRDDTIEILTVFARCVAARWRSTDIISGKSYKTTRQIQSIEHSFERNMAFWNGVKPGKDTLVVTGTPQQRLLDVSRARMVESLW
jgi:hypothetical protein